MDNIKTGDVMSFIEKYKAGEIDLESMEAVVEGLRETAYYEGLRDEADSHWCDEN